MGSFEHEGREMRAPLGAERGFLLLSSTLVSRRCGLILSSGLILMRSVEEAREDARRESPMRRVEEAIEEVRRESPGEVE